MTERNRLDLSQPQPSEAELLADVIGKAALALGLILLLAMAGAVLWQELFA